MNLHKTSRRFLRQISVLSRKACKRANLRHASILVSASSRFSLVAELGIRLNVGKMSANQAAHDVGRLAWDLVHGYAAHIAAIRIAPRLDHKAAVKLIADHPSDSVQHKVEFCWVRPVFYFLQIRRIYVYKAEIKNTFYDDVLAYRFIAFSLC